VHLAKLEDRREAVFLFLRYDDSGVSVILHPVGASPHELPLPPGALP